MPWPSVSRVVPRRRTFLPARVSPVLRPKGAPRTLLPLSTQRVEKVSVDVGAWGLYGTLREAALDNFIRNLAKSTHTLAHHAADSRKSEAGLPDWQWVGHRIVWVENKRVGGLPTVDRIVAGSGERVIGQETWLRGILDAGGEAYLLYTTDLPCLHELLLDGPKPSMPPVRRIRRWVRDRIWEVPCKPAGIPAVSRRRKPAA